MDSEAATLAYSLDNEVGEELRLVDGFYDCGRGWGPTMENIGVPSLLELFAQEGAVRGREVKNSAGNDKPTAETRVSQSGKLYNLVRILYVYCTYIVQLLYNFIHCDLSYTNRFKCTMSLVLQTCTCAGSGVIFRPVARSVPSHRCL